MLVNLDNILKNLNGFKVYTLAILLEHEPWYFPKYESNGERIPECFSYVNFCRVSPKYPQDRYPVNSSR